MLQGSSGLKAASWKEAFAAIAEKAKGTSGNQMKAIVGKLVDAEAMVALKDLMNRLGCGNLVHEGGFKDMNADARSIYLANSRIAGVDQADFILLLGANPKVECPVFNARIRKATLEGTRVSDGYGSVTHFPCPSL